MLWELEIQPQGPDRECERVREEYDLVTHSTRGATLIRRTARGYLLESEVERSEIERLASTLLVDTVTETARLRPLGLEAQPAGEADRCLTVLLKPGVMDATAQSVLETAQELGIPLQAVRTFRRYYVTDSTADPGLHKTLANDAIEQVIAGMFHVKHLGLGSHYRLKINTVPIRTCDETSLLCLSKEGQLSLSLAEMQTIQAHYRSLGREPTDVELETIAQTWSEHCSHKTLKGQIEMEGRRYQNLLKETIFGATQEIRRRLGADDWCVSVFEDNAGVVRFDDRYHVCFKVETHNHPSAIEPYGGANTGLGGVIRDPLGTGLGAKPIANTDVFCFAPPDTPVESLPAGVLHPVRVFKGVVAGVRDYGNRMGIPTVNGAVCFDARYLGNPLVFCGTVGLIPVDRSHKEPRAGDLIVTAGGRTGRDGIHGATFSSIELTSESEKVSGGAVQIGNPITEKKLLDVILEARDRGLYHAITDCGAGGFSSAIGEMGERLGARVDLDKAPLKYEGLSYTEIWISEAQERMILAVPPENWPALRDLFASENVEATVIGQFEATGRLQLYFQGQRVGDLDMAFLHHGRPEVVRQAIAPPASAATSLPPASSGPAELTQILTRILGAYNVCSKEWIVRQYDHEVQGGTVIKPLVGLNESGPGDAAVITPVLGLTLGLALGCGLNPRYGDRDPYRMAAAAIDEAVRNVVAVGADPRRIALLDNFCWGNTDRPEVLGSLVRAAEACRDVALAFGMPFISGKDSLNNEFRAGDRTIIIPPTLLISALGRVPDVRRCVTMDLKGPGHRLFLVGETRAELGGSHYCLVTGQEGGEVPRVNLTLAPPIFAAVHRCIMQGLVRSCHDLSEGGLAVAIAEMSFAGGIGADLILPRTGSGLLPDVEMLFSESTSRFLIEVEPAKEADFRGCLGPEVPVVPVGQTCAEPRLRIAGSSGEWLIWSPLAALREAWQAPLRW